MRRILTSLIVFAAVTVQLAAGDFSVEEYKNFLENNRDMTTADLLDMYPAGVFEAFADVKFADAEFSEEVDEHFQLTDYEKSLIDRHGFAVTERVSHNRFAYGFLDVYKSHLPVYVSSDAILHALHMSYDAILIDFEEQIIIPELTEFLNKTLALREVLEQRYGSDAGMQASLRDYDVHLTVTAKLLGMAAQPYYAENQAVIADLLDLVEGQSATSYPLYTSGTGRKMDFSQFTPRGHYTQSEELTRYFQAMMWLGRTELYIKAPEESGQAPLPADIQRQAITSLLIAQAAAESGAINNHDKINNILEAFIGEQDNVALRNLLEVKTELNIQDVAELTDENTFAQYQQTMINKSYAPQRILSQILMSDPMDPDQIEPAVAFLVMGQRFIVDSYVFSNVVYDRVTFENEKVRRMLPSHQDILFALGNNASVQLLENELDQFNYGSNLAGLRYMIDQYDENFWDASIYTNWLNSIRSLNPPDGEERAALPQFMQTAAWWQKTMNTQLASWSQLRHDNLLYAKQSYSGGIGCQFPESYVEPVPATYDAIAGLARRAYAAVEGVEFADPQTKTSMLNYFTTLEGHMGTLSAIAQNQLAQVELTDDQKTFLRTMIFDIPQGCDVNFGGWYTSLYYTGNDGMKTTDMVVADVHTAPTDAAGNTVGWVMHVGTGKVNMAFILVENCLGTPTVYCGPVMSYHEMVSLNFKRHTDEEWATMQNGAEPPARPDFVNLYLADENGEAKGNIGQTLHMSVTDVEDNPANPANGGVATAPAYPNPFAASTLLQFTVPTNLAYEQTTVNIYDLSGRLVRSLFSDHLPAGAMQLRWDGTDESGKLLSNGVYVYEVQIGDQHGGGQLTIAR